MSCKVREAVPRSKLFSRVTVVQHLTDTFSFLFEIPLVQSDTLQLLLERQTETCPAWQRCWKLHVGNMSVQVLQQVSWNPARIVGGTDPGTQRLLLRRVCVFMLERRLSELGLTPELLSLYWSHSSTVLKVLFTSAMWKRFWLYSQHTSRTH